MHYFVAGRFWDLRGGGGGDWKKKKKISKKKKKKKAWNGTFIFENPFVIHIPICNFRNQKINVWELMNTKVRCALSTCEETGTVSVEVRCGTCFNVQWQEGKYTAPFATQTNNCWSSRPDNPEVKKLARVVGVVVEKNKSTMVSLDCLLPTIQVRWHCRPFCSRQSARDTLSLVTNI